jgi:hypothetical protein
MVAEGRSYKVFGAGVDEIFNERNSSHHDLHSGITVMRFTMTDPGTSGFRKPSFRGARLLVVNSLPSRYRGCN